MGCERCASSTDRRRSAELEAGSPVNFDRPPGVASIVGYAAGPKLELVQSGESAPVLQLAESTEDQKR